MSAHQFIWIGLAAALLLVGVAIGVLQANREGRDRTPRPLDVSEAKVVMDLDRLVASPVGFVWKGKNHFIKPMDTKTYLKVLNDCARMDEIFKRPTRDHRAVINAYARLFATVCTTIGPGDVGAMSQAQVRALFNQIMNCVRGQAQVDPVESEGAQKKTVPA